MPQQISTEILIAAPPARVWSILIDFSGYGSWNPFIRLAAGDPAPGQRLHITVEPPGRRAMRFHPTVLRAEAPRELAWRGRFLMPGLFDGEHRFELLSHPVGTLFRHGETFGGVLVPLAGSGLLAATAAGFEAMNRALKARAESVP